MKYKITLLLTCFCFVYAQMFSQKINKKDSLALVDLYNSTDGPNWKKHYNWLGTKPVKTWYGIYVTGTRVTSINLQLNKLSGTLPNSIGALTEVANLYLNTNTLTGSIPASIGNMINLQYLTLSRNQLSGSIPRQLGNLVNLESLHLDFNKLSGNVPYSITNLTKLSYLDISHNRLQGHLTDSISRLKSLYYLYIDHNRFSGKISSAIASLQINSLYLSYNKFTFSGMELIVQTIPQVDYNYQKQLHIHEINNALSVSAGGTLSNNTYQWFSTDSSSVTITGDSVFHPVQSGAYYVHVTNSVATQLTLLSDTAEYALNDINLFQNTVTASHSYSKIKIFTAYPNPAKDEINISCSGDNTYILINSEGKKIITKTFNDSGVIYIKNLPAGIYYLKNISAGLTKKIIVIQ